MAGIKRFITYIYAYENGTKGINAGFAKVEIRGNECRIEVHLRGTPIRMGMDQVYLFKVEGGQMLAFPMGEMRMIEGSGDYGTIIKADQIGGLEYSFFSFSFWFSVPPTSNLCGSHNLIFSVFTANGFPSVQRVIAIVPSSPAKTIPSISANEYSDPPI